MIPYNTVYIDGGAPGTGDGLNTFVQTCDTFTTLRAFIGLNGMQVSVLGAAAAGDGNGGTFYFSDTSTAADDNVSVIVPTGAVGAWLRSGGSLDMAPASASLSSLNPLYFGTYSQLAGVRDVLNLSAAISDSPSSFRDAFYASITDSDRTVYSGSHSNYAGRFAAFGPNAAGSFVTGYKNYVGINAYGYGATAYPFGVSGINADAVQYGAGIGDNELACAQPSGALAQSVSLAAVQATITNDFADADDAHTAYGVLSSNAGTKLISAPFAYSGNGTQRWFLQANGAAVTESAIVMPTSDGPSGNEGSIIDYGTWNGNPAGGSYSQWKRNTHGGEYSWVNNGVIDGRLSAYGIQVGPDTAQDPSFQGPFIYLTSCQGTPTGVPVVASAGQTPIIYDYSGKKLWVYDFVTTTWLGVVVA